MRTLRFLVTVLFFSLVIVSQANAQYEADRPARFIIKIGVYTPHSSDLKDYLGSNWLTLSAAYVTKLDDSEKPSEMISMDMSRKDDQYFDGSIIGCQYIRTLRPLSGSQKIYMSLGGGFFLLSEKQEEHFSEDYGWMPERSYTGVQIGYTIAAGVDIGTNYLAEVRYTGVDELTDDLNFSGMSFYAGAAFEF